MDQKGSKTPVLVMKVVYDRLADIFSRSNGRGTETIEERNTLGEN